MKKGNHKILKFFVKIDIIVVLYFLLQMKVNKIHDGLGHILDHIFFLLLIILGITKLVLFIKKHFYHPIKKYNIDIDYDSMSGLEFEQFCADILYLNGFRNVTVTKASNDYGIDIIAYQEKLKYAIQCKCYSSNISNTAVQEAFTGKAYYKADVAVVLTNQDFTPNAMKMAKQVNVLLWNRNVLDRMILAAVKLQQKQSKQKHPQL